MEDLTGTSQASRWAEDAAGALRMQAYGLRCLDANRITPPAATPVADSQVDCSSTYVVRLTQTFTLRTGS